MRRVLLLLVACGSDSAVLPPQDAEAPCDACVDAPADVAPRPCGTDGWLTYGHDARRTFATDACITGPLSPSWTYAPTAPSGKTVGTVAHALASTDGIYLHWGASGSATSTAADKISPQGMHLWTFDSGTDANLGEWDSVSGSNLVMDDDGVFFVDLATGTGGASTGVDWWGQSIPSGDGGVFCVTQSKADGPGVLVARLDAMAKVLWKGNEQGTQCKQSLSDVMGGIALDGGVLFYAPVYKTGSAVQPSFTSGVYAFDATSGATKWSVASQPASAVSAGNGLLYLAEGAMLVARNQGDGGIAWSVALPGPSGQAPVLTDELVIASGTSGVSAFDKKTGAPKWSAMVPGSAVPAYASSSSNACAGLTSSGGAIVTTMAAALPTGTLVVTGTDGVHVLRLADGSEQWAGPIGGGHLHDPILVGKTVYLVDSPFVGYLAPGSLIALTAP